MVAGKTRGAIGSHWEGWELSKRFTHVELNDVFREETQDDAVIKPDITIGDEIEIFFT